jgi:2-polyprenyl-3-methyl-5-hydroxy-6-metoxy-1,4-benzoquinol methylase
MNSVTKKVKAQYNKYPYPSYSWFAKVDPVAACHASFEAGYALIHRQIKSHRGKKIALLGCGTFEPYAHGKLHPQAHIDAVDLSPSSLKRAQWRCRIRGVNNVSFHNKNLVEFCAKKEETYDYIHCFGVLHHLENPLEGFKAIAQALNEDGFARIMVYSSTQRFRTQLIQKVGGLLGLDSGSDKSISKIKKLLNLLPISHPLRLSQILNPELETKSGVVDSLLHACENSFTFSELKKVLKASQLHIHDWDFSENVLKLLSYAPSKNSNSTLAEKIEYLEAFDQWPTSFTLWVSKAKPQETPPLEYRTNPHLKGHIQRSLPSTVLRKTIKLSPYEREILERGIKTPVTPDENRIKNLIASRFLLGIDLWN